MHAPGLLVAACLLTAADSGDTCDIFTNKLTGETFRGKLIVSSAGLLYVKVPPGKTRKLTASEWIVTVAARTINVPTTRPVSTTRPAVTGKAGKKPPSGPRRIVFRDAGRVYFLRGYVLDHRLAVYSDGLARLECTVTNKHQGTPINVTGFRVSILHSDGTSKMYRPKCDSRGIRPGGSRKIRTSFKIERKRVLEVRYLHLSYKRVFPDARD